MDLVQMAVADLAVKEGRKSANPNPGGRRNNERDAGPADQINVRVQALGDATLFMTTIMPLATSSPSVFDRPYTDIL